MDKYVLSNGMKCIFLPNKNVKSFIFLVNIKVGSNNENKDNNGIAHFLEHMMFKSTRSYSSTELLEKLDSIGAYYNAMTTNEYTQYYIKSNYKNIYDTIKLMNEIYFYPKFLESDINTERTVVLDEYMINQNDDDSVLYDNMINHLYGDSPLGRPILGTPNTINNFKRDDFMNFRKKYYQPQNTCIVLSGNFKLKTIKSYIKKKFNKQFKNQVSYPVKYIKKLQSSPELICKFEKESIRTTIILCFRTYGFNHVNSYTLEIIASILTGGMSSRLFLKLRNKKGFVYNVSAYQKSYTNYGYFCIETSCNTEYVYEVIKIILEELKVIKKTHVTNKELRKSQASIVNSIIFMNESSFSKANYYSMNELFYKPKITLDKLSLKYENVTITDVKNTCNDVFNNNNLNVITMGGIKKNNKLLKMLNI